MEMPIENPVKESPVRPVEATCTPYHKPSLKDLGDIRSLTLGITGGVGESGYVGIRRNP